MGGACHLYEESLSSFPTTRTFGLSTNQFSILPKPKTQATKDRTVATTCQTLQSPHNQAGILDPKKFPEYVCLGGGFGQVANDGYGVSYNIASEDVMFFHVSSKRTSPETDTSRFIGLLAKSLQDVKQIFL
ncbi:Carnitine O-palmitoyltransferase 1, liver isoform [Araneus ventricosus]|uniref:Carnitine O-palmitoyltransferase 1, liver isoform n=1 Tax=Araneus ventricosus TaxID=182803 RepID=A0A4Y2QN90_ARAVE|nr:Carnitine O-palmitoyltransferase 1, liver isoform [Araneus ventricosus]